MINSITKGTVMQLSKKIATVAPSLALQITAKAKQLKAQGIDVISFGAGEPDFDTPECIKQKAIKAIQDGFTKYTPAAGMPQLKTAIVEKLKKDNGLEYTDKQVVVSCGAKHSLFNVFQVILNDGDEVIIPAPYWLSYPEMVKLGGGAPIFIETTQASEYKMTARQLEAAITPRTRAVILNSPSNPTGGIYTAGELKALAEVIVKKDILVVSDEIYEYLIYDGQEHISIASLGQEIKDRTVLVNGMSKGYSMTGWRIGYIAAPETIAKAVATLQSHSTSNPTSFAQVGALAALECAQDDVKKMLVSFEARRNLIMDELAKIPTIKAFRSQGAFYVFCDVSDTGLNAMDFATRILDEANVAVIPGGPFGMPNHIRLSFAISEEAIKKGVVRIKDWIETL
jgi:aspartate aminotransferase